MKLKILAFAFALTVATNLSAQTFTVLHNFSGVAAYPQAGVTISGDTLYGTTAGYSVGTVFSVKTDGTDFNILNTGGNPRSNLVISNDMIYGTTVYGGSNGNGAVFSMKTDGTNFKALHSFADSDGANPYAGLTLSGNLLYGATFGGGDADNGTIFSINTDGTRFTVLHAINTYSDAAFIGSSLVLSGNTLFGAGSIGGIGGTHSGKGAIFSLKTDGSDYILLHNFTAIGYTASGSATNGDGLNPVSVIMSDNTLYGITGSGGSQGDGTIFSMNTDGTDFMVLHNFTDNDPYPKGLLLSGNIIYGIAFGGPQGGQPYGEVFSIGIDGSSFTVLHSFSGGDGEYPVGLMLSRDTLYGTTVEGGSNYNYYGTVFALNLAPSAPVITTQPQNQTVQVGSNVAFSVVASGVPSPNYQWQFNGQNLAGQTAASLSLTNVQFANAGGYSVIVTNAYGSVTSAVAQLTVFTNLVVTQTNRAPTTNEIGQPTIPTDATHFKIYTNGMFKSGVALNPNKMTVVLTHGWNDSSTNWPEYAAQTIQRRIGSNTVNLVAWDWSNEAGTVFSIPGLQLAAMRTQGQGVFLGKNLITALGSNYSQRIHFIGHSLGTLVNAAAANYVHTNGFSWSNTQMTLCDEAEGAWVFESSGWQMATTMPEIVQQGVATLQTFDGNFSTPQPGWAHPLPNQFAWADNYVSAFGMLHSNAANVILTKNFPVSLPDVSMVFQEFYNFHDYAHFFYEDTIEPGFNTGGAINATYAGFICSFEGGGYAGRPGTNTYFYQDPNGLELSLVQTNLAFATNLLNARFKIYQLIGISSGLSQGENTVFGAVAQALGQFNGQIVSAGQNLENMVLNFRTSLGSGSLIQNSGAHPLGGPVPMGGGTGNTPAYAWVPLNVPSNALSMSFDFMLQGNGNQDSFQAALDGTNILSLETSLIQTNVLLNSGMISVSQYAGRQVTLFMGIVGGTSTNAALTVSNFQFYVALPPSLQIQLAGTNVVLAWPLSGAGYVLQSANQLTPPISWTTVTNVPVIVNFQYTVTNQVSGAVRFYRLSE